MVEEWTIRLEGALKGAAEAELDRGSIESCAAPGCHGAAWTDGRAQEWTGVPLYLVMGRVDDELKHDTGAFNRTLAGRGYAVSIVAQDGYSITLDSARLADNPNIILARHDFPGKRWIEGLIDLPIVVPHTAAGIALLAVFGRQAPVGRLAGALGIDFVDRIPGIVVGMLFVSLPYLVDTAREAFARIDPELERVAETLGATRWEAFRYVTLPLAGRGILAGALLMWGRGISEFGAVMILAYHPRIVPVLVYERFAGFGLQSAHPVAALRILTALGLFLLLRGVLLRPPSEETP